MRFSTSIFAVCIALGGLVLPAVADFMIFTDRDSFNATAGKLNFEDFEKDFSVSDTVTFAGFSVSEVEGTSNGLGQARNFPGLLDESITGGTGAILFDDNGDSIGRFFDFADSYNAFGVDITTSEDATVQISGDVDATIELSARSPQFFGVISTSGFLNQLDFEASGGPNVGFDSASYGQASLIPEPSSFVIVCASGFGFALFRRRRK